MAPRAVSFVTDELYPFTAGGIGRLLHNLALDTFARDDDIEIHFLVPDFSGIKPDQVRAVFGPRSTLHIVSEEDGDGPIRDGERLYPPARAFTDSRQHAQSLAFMRALKQLETRGQPFDVIEFPDFKGWAYCTLQEKRLGLAFSQAEISIRLHTSQGVLQHFDRCELSWEQLGRFELERKALHDADRIIAHLEPIAKFNMEYYGFDPSWMSKVTIQFPPVVYPPSPQPVRAALQTKQRDIVFPTKIQPFKHPELFVRGTALFLRVQPQYPGRIFFACRSTNDEYTKTIQALIPEDLRHRYVFVAPGPERDALLSESAVVIPSIYESLNLTAYEVSAAGGIPVLNARCLAFGPASPFVDGENCLLFDGTPKGLAQALVQAVTTGSISPVRWSSDAPYYLRLPSAKEVKSPRAKRSNAPLVSVVMTNHNLGQYLTSTVANVGASTYKQVELILVDDASTQPSDLALLDRLEQGQPVHSNAIKVIRNGVNRGLAASRNVGIDAAQGKYVLPLDADDCISPEFLAGAVRALEDNPEFSAVIPTAAYFQTDAQYAERRFHQFACHLGDVPSLGLVANRLGCATSLLRRSALQVHPYNERLSSYEDWELYLRLVHQGHRFLVTNEIHFFYRQRPESMSAGMNPVRHLEHLSWIYESLHRPLPASVRMWSVLVPLRAAVGTSAEAMRGPMADSSAPKPLRYILADKLNQAVKQIPGVHGLLRRSASVAGAWKPFAKSKAHGHL